MSTLFGGNVHAGLTGLELAEDIFDLDEGIRLRKTYAHLMSPLLVAFAPAPQGKHHPGPWKSVTGGLSFDINAELFIPASIESQFGSTISVAKTIVFLLRLGVNPATTLPVFSSHPFSATPKVSDMQTQMFPYEIQPRHFPLGVDGGVATPEAIDWVRNHWKVTHKLLTNSSEFSLAVDAIDSGQFVHNTALTLVSLWGALEALFSPSTSELKFRVSSLIASFLMPRGDSRLSLQKDIAKLYDKRSAAAHGKPTHDSEHLLQTFNLLRDVLIKIINREQIPTKDELESMLFGAATS